MPAAHSSASAMELPGAPSGARWGQIEKSTNPRVESSLWGGRHWMKSSPTSGVITMLPALSPTHTVRSEEHTSELQSLMRISYDVFCFQKNINPVYTKKYRTTSN